MVKDQGEPWLIQANGGHKLGLKSLGDQMNLHMSSMGTHHPIWVWRVSEVTLMILKACGMLEDEDRVEVAWAHLNMISGSWGFIDEPHAFDLWNIVYH